MLLAIILGKRRVLWALKISSMLSARPLGLQRQSRGLRALELGARVGCWAGSLPGRFECICKDISCVFSLFGKVDHDLLFLI